MTLMFHVGLEDMQGKVHCPVIILVADYLISIALEELLYLNSSLSYQEKSRLQQTCVFRICLVERRSQSSTYSLTFISFYPRVP